MASVSASIATAVFNKEFIKYSLKNGKSLEDIKPAHFDSRVFTIPDYTEVENYLIWRQKDCTKNSITSVAQSLYSHKELQNKNSNEKQELIHQKGQNWNDYPAGQKRGRCCVKEGYEIETLIGEETVVVSRNRWVVIDPPILTQDRDFIKKHVPRTI